MHANLTKSYRVGIIQTKETICLRLTHKKICIHIIMFIGLPLCVHFIHMDMLICCGRGCDAAGMHFGGKEEEEEMGLEDFVLCICICIFKYK